MKCPSIQIDSNAPPLKLDFMGIELRTGETSGCHRCSCAVGGGQCRSLCHSPSSLLLCCQSSSQVSYFYLFACCGIFQCFGLIWTLQEVRCQKTKKCPSVEICPEPVQIQGVANGSEEPRWSIVSGNRNGREASRSYQTHVKHFIFTFWWAAAGIVF